MVTSMMPSPTMEGEEAIVYWMTATLVNLVLFYTDILQSFLFGALSIIPLMASRVHIYQDDPHSMELHSTIACIWLIFILIVCHVAVSSLGREFVKLYLAGEGY